jgi:hypothetical protein
VNAGKYTGFNISRTSAVALFKILLKSSAKVPADMFLGLNAGLKYNFRDVQ